MSGCVYLIGAGCGDRDLITLRGAKLLGQCDTVLYDALIDSRLLDLAPDAEKICVGKRSGRHSVPQEETNALLVELALSGKKVARLKGGDPFVFGRGGEEVLALREAGVPYIVVPGITSSVAAPELAGIPVTHRRLSRSFHVMTAHTADGAADYSKYAGLDGTLVFLMGLERLSDIATGLISGGMSAQTPAAVISCGGTPKQRTVRASLETIAGSAEREQLEAPAVIVVGAAAELDFSATLRLPLTGVTAAVVGTEKFTAKLSEMLEAHGAAVSCLDCLEIAEYHDNPALDDALSRIEEYSCIVLTSMNGADIFLRRMRRERVDLRQLYRTKIAVIGSGTAAYLEKYGLFADIIPEKYTSAALGELLAEKFTPVDRLLIARAEQGSEELTVPLEKADIPFDDVKAYDTLSRDSGSARQVTEDYLIFASQSGVRAFFESGFTVSERTKVVCIGDITAKELSGRMDVLVAAPHTAEGIVQKILEEEA